MTPKSPRTSRTPGNAPIIAVGGFNLLTLLVLATAPVAWETPNLFQLYSFVLFCQLLMLIGFRLGRRGPRAVHRSASMLSAATT